MRTTSLWGVAAKSPAPAPKMRLIPGPRVPQGYSRISLSMPGRILKEYQNIVSAAELPELAIRAGKPFLTTDDHVPVSLLYCDESIEVSRFIDFFYFFPLCLLIKHDWSMTELQWSWISNFSVYHDRNYCYILLPTLWVMWLNHQRVTICFMKIAM